MFKRGEQKIYFIYKKNSLGRYTIQLDKNIKMTKA